MFGTLLGGWKERSKCVSQFVLTNVFGTASLNEMAFVQRLWAFCLGSFVAGGVNICRGDSTELGLVIENLSLSLRDEADL